MAQRVEVVVSDEEREVLERWARRPKSAQALALRCRIVLAAADGQPSNEIAARLGCSRHTVGKWRGRFARRGLDGCMTSRGRASRVGSPMSRSSGWSSRRSSSSLPARPTGRRARWLARLA